ncbi:MAG: alpha-hydroxy acid oxidase [Rhodospirillaceae bacterium]|jgi:L-lactate dehydrogenase (cytochrome)
MSLPSIFKNIACLEDLEVPARARLPKALFEFAVSGVEANISRAANRAAFDEIFLQPRILKDVSNRDIKRDLLGHTYDAPFGISPMGASAMFGFEADLAFARAAQAANIPFCMSGSALIPMEKIAAANPDVWFQAYVEASRESMEVLTNRAGNAGIKTLVVTVDVPVPGNRRTQLRKGFEYPIRPSARIAWDGLTHPRWLLGTFFRTLMTTGMPHIENYGAGRGIPMISTSAPQRKHVRDALDWDDMKWLRDTWEDRLLIKGVLAPEDARRANKIGLDGLIVSNHGGRQLDTALPSIRALPGIVAEKGNLTIILDSGVRRGTDVVKALGLGADFVFVGRPFLYAASLGEEPGVAYAIEILASEVDRTIALLGLMNFEGAEERLMVA